MKINIRHLSILAGASLVAACAPHAPGIQLSELDEARALIAKAKQAGAERCAPERQAEAVAKLYAAAHTDSRGKGSYNMALSECRAKSVMDYLIAHGITASRLSSHGYGETRPVADNGTATGRAKNRRVELRVR